MQSDPVAFGINKDAHVSIVRTDLCFGYDHLSSCCFNPVQDDLYIGITIEIDERAMRFRRLIKPFGIDNGASDTCSRIIDRKHPHLDHREIHRKELDLKDGFIEAGSSIEVSRWDLEP